MFSNRSPPFADSVFHIKRCVFKNNYLPRNIFGGVPCYTQKKS